MVITNFTKNNLTVEQLKCYSTYTRLMIEIYELKNNNTIVH